MIKVAAAVIKYEDKVLLMRRAPGQKHAGTWEYPGGKVENGERTSAALARELDEELYIKAKIGKLITSVSDGEYEIFAYDVKYFDGLITLHVHDDMQWVTLTDALKYNLLPADRKIVLHMTKTKEQSKPKLSLQSVINQIIEQPVFDEKIKLYVVAIKNVFFGTTRYFNTQHSAMQFYMDTVRNIVKTVQSTQMIRQK